MTVFMTDSKHSNVPEKKLQLILMGFGAVLQLLTAVEFLVIHRY